MSRSRSQSRFANAISVLSGQKDLIARNVPSVRNGLNDPNAGGLMKPIAAGASPIA